MGTFTADLCDEHSSKVSLLAAGWQNYGGADMCEGVITTLKLDKNNADLVALLRDEDGSGKVVVVDVDQDYYAVVGENLMKFAQNNNYAGIVINGYVRDTFQIQDIPVALFAIGTCSRKSIPVTSGERDIPLNFGGITFTPGEYLYGDMDGIVVTKEKID
ncbi:MAG: ribonuclease E activity regulator RraA [Cellvibrionaceae bacterium]